MPENNQENISKSITEYSMISFFSKKMRIGVVGAGRAGFIKASHFAKEGCYVEILSKEISEELKELYKYNVNILDKEYTKDFIKDKHIIIIAINSLDKVKEIRRDCEEEFKLYIDSTSFLEGMAVVPVQRELKNIVIAVNTKTGNPKGAVFLGDKTKELLRKYDDFISFTSVVRNKTKDKEYKKEIMEYVFTEDFQFFFNRGEGENVLRMFYSCY